MYVSVPPKLVLSDFVRRAKGRSSFKVQQEFPELKKRYWGRRFWGRGYISTTSGAITDDVIFSIWKTTSRNLPASAGSRLVPADFVFSIFWLLLRLSQLQTELNDEVEIQILASQVPLRDGADDCDITIHVGRSDNVGARDVCCWKSGLRPSAAWVFGKSWPFVSSQDLLKTQLLSLSRPPSAEWQICQGWFDGFGIADDRPHNYMSFNNYDMVTQAAVAGDGFVLGWLGLIDAPAESEIAGSGYARGRRQ